MLKCDLATLNYGFMPEQEVEQLDNLKRWRLYINISQR